MSSVDVQEYLKEKGPILLEAFDHQVGGHSLLMKLGEHVCKPLLPREHFFYESIPLEIRTFTPQYHGVISVSFKRVANGDITLVAHPAQNGTLAKPYAMPLAHTPHPPSDLRINTTNVKCSSGSSMHDGKNGITYRGNGINPWAAQCIQNTKQKLEDFGDRLEVMLQDYVVLENLTRKFRNPCILDLKVGTRQYGDDVSEDKKLKHIARCAHSTSHALGVRICGMQTYNSVTDEYTFRDKYFGRDLTEDGFHTSIRDFLHNGVCLRTDLLSQLIEMLTALREMVRKQNTYRFFSSSLLIIYDGNDVVTHPPQRAAPMEPLGSGGTSTVVGGYTCLGSGLSSPGVRGTVRVKLERERTENHTVTPCHMEPLEHTDNGKLDLQQARSKVDVRMIDFAHTTHGGYLNDIIKYSGPDEGYIQGLNTLIGMFVSMLEAHRHGRVI